MIDDVMKKGKIKLSVVTHYKVLSDEILYLLEIHGKNDQSYQCAVLNLETRRSLLLQPRDVETLHTDHSESFPLVKSQHTTHLQQCKRETLTLL